MPTAWKLVAVLCLAVGAVVFLQSLFYSEGWGRREQVRLELEVLQQENEATKQKIAELRREIEAIRTRTEVQERLVRDQLGYVRPSDLVVELSQDAGKR